MKYEEICYKGFSFNQLKRCGINNTRRSKGLFALFSES